MDCTSCGRTNRPTARFCDVCGKPLAPACPTCGSECRADSQFCDACGASLAARGAGDAAARKVVTIVFADLVGSTSLHERIDAESARRLMDRYYRALHATVESHGGTVVKLLGDGVMAAFGVPRVAEDDAIRAVHAAVGMQRAFRELALTHSGTADEVGLRVAVNTGEVVVSDDHSDVVGDPVNLAARLQAEAHDGDVLIGESTQRLVADLVTVAPFGALALKGRAEAVAAFRVVSLDRPAGAAATAFVGRDDELRRIMAVYDSAVARPGARLAVILGSPGLGKSRLIAELARRVGNRATVLTAHCNATGGATFAPIAEALRTLLGIDDGTGGDALRAAVGAVVTGEASEHARITDGVSALLAGTPASPEETFFFFRRFLAAAATTRPVVLAIDDLQWAEPLLLDLTEHLVQWSTDVPLLVLVAARPELREMRASLVTPGGLVSEVLTLTGLDAGAATRLAASVIGADELPAAIAGRVLAASEGNPLFVGELVRMLVHDGALKREGDRWTAGVELAQLEMPPTIHALLAARIERLRPEERTVLERAAVVGRQFSRTAVAQLMSREMHADLDARFESLRRSELIEPDAGWFLGEPLLRFHHGLIRDAAYRRLLKNTRAELHGRFADWLESRVGEAVEHEETIGRHLEQAHGYLGELGPIDEHGRALGVRAARYLAAAGRRALARDDLSLAASLLGRALDRLDATAPTRADLALDWCEALLAAGEVGGAERALSELARFTGDSARYRAWHTCFACQLAVLTSPQTLHATADAVEAAAGDLAAAGDAAGEAKAHSIHALALARLGKVGACEAALDRALAAARRANDRRRANAVLAGAPLAALWGPSPVTRASGRCLDVVRVLRITQGAPAVEAVALSCQAVLEALRGRTDAARRMIASSRHMVEELGITHRLLEVDVFTGMIELLEDDGVAAERALRRAYDGLRSHGLGIDAAQAAAFLGRALLAQGRGAEAEALSHESEALAGDDLKAAIAWRVVRAVALASRGEHASAIEIARGAVEIAAATDALLDHADARRALAAALRAAGRSGEADAEEARAIELWEAKGATLLVQRARSDVPRVAETERAAEDRAAPACPVRRRVRPNAATAIVAGINAAFAAREGDALAGLLADSVNFADHTARAAFDRQDLLTTWRLLLRADDLTYRLEQLATLGDSLALCRVSVAASGVARGQFDVGAYEFGDISLIEVDARARLVRLERFADDRLGDAIARLYKRYAELLPDGPARERAAATARSVTALVGPLDVDRWATAYAPAIEFADYRTVGLGSVHGAEALRRAVRALLELFEDYATRVDDIADLRPDALVVRWTNFGTARASGGAFERCLCQLWVFGADGLVTHWEQSEADQDEAALARFDELAAEPTAAGFASATSAAERALPSRSTRRRVRANAATANAARCDAAVAARDAEAFPPLYADSIETVHHPTATVYDRSGALAAWRGLLKAEDPTLAHESLATLGDSLALCRQSWSASGVAGAKFDVGAYEREQIILIEVDADGRRRRLEIFAADRLGDAVARLYERYAELLPDGPTRARAAVTPSSVAAILNPFVFDRWATAIEPAIEFVDHRTVGIGSVQGAEAVLRSVCVLYELSADFAMRIDDILVLRSDALLVHMTTSGTNRTSGGAFERPFLFLLLFGADGLVARIEQFDTDHEDEALGRSDELTVEPTAARFASAASADERALPSQRVRRRVHPNAATVHATRLDATIAARDADALVTLIADESEVVDHTTGVTYDRQGLLDSWCSLLRAQDPEHRHEPLATLGDSLAVCRLSLSASGFAGRQFDVGAYEREKLTLIEVDTNGRRRRSESFAADRLNDAVVRLYARYAELLPDGPVRERAAATARSVAAHLETFDRDRWASAFAPAVEVVDHRILGTWSTRGSEGMLQHMQSLLDVAEDIAIGVDEVLSLGSDALLLRRTHSGTDRASGGTYERLFIQLFVFGADGLITRLEWFEVDREDQALARFDELTDLTAELPAARFTNTATRVADRIQTAWETRDWGRFKSLFSPGFRGLDRRAMLRADIDRDRFLESMRPIFDMSSSRRMHDVHATRGDRLALFHLGWKGADRTIGPSEIDLLQIIEVDANGDVAVMIGFDANDFDAAYAELDDRYFAGEAAASGGVAATMRAFVRAIASRDWDAMLALLSPDLVANDHRPLDCGTLRGPAVCVETLKSLVDLAPDVRLRKDHMQLSERAALLVDARVGTREAGAFEAPRAVIFAFDERGQIDSMDFYNPEQIDAARARFDAIRARADLDPPAAVVIPNGATHTPLRIPPSAATRARDCAGNALAARDWPALRALTSEDFVFEDRTRRPSLSGDVELWIRSHDAAGSSPGAPPARELVATLGDRVALERVVATEGAGGNAFEDYFFLLTEVAADGRLRASITFALEARRAAFAEAQARFIAGEAAATGGQAPIAAMEHAFAQHDSDGLRAYLADEFVFHDHRTLGVLGMLNGDRWVESLRVQVDMAPDVDVESSRILAWNGCGRVTASRVFGTLRDGGPFESILVRVIVTGGDRVQRLEVFDVGDADQALARFAELSSRRG